MFVGIMIGLLLASVVFNIFLLVTRHSVTRLLQEERESCVGRFDSVLDRLSSAPTLVLEPAQKKPAVDLEARRYFPDTIDADDAWNEYRGEAPEDEDVEVA